MKKRILTLLITTLLSLNACDERVVLLQALNQRDANEISVILSKENIEAKIETIKEQQETSWQITVSKSDLDESRNLLVAHNLPRVKKIGLEGICKDAGLIPTPKTEKCRELLATKGEVINSLESIPGVVSADVVINIPDKEDFPDENTPQARPSASVVLQVQDTAIHLTESKVQQHVANAVPNMDMRDVAVIISRPSQINSEDQNQDLALTLPDNPIPTDKETTPELPQPELDEEEEFLGQELISVGGLKLDSESATKFKIIASLFLILFVLLSAGLILVLLKMAKMRTQQNQANTTSLANTQPPALAENIDVDELVAQTGGDRVNR